VLGSGGFGPEGEVAHPEKMLTASAIPVKQGAEARRNGKWIEYRIVKIVESNINAFLNQRTMKFSSFPVWKRIQNRERFGKAYER
jgi:hypothetical protein